jgi:excisionase family DNA binding protein
MNEVPVMLTIKETSEKSGLPYSFIRNKCHNGEIVHIKTGRKFLVNWDRFLDFLNGREVRSNE